MAEENLLFVSASAVEEGKQSIPAETQMSSNSSVLTDNNLSDNLAFEPEKAVVGSPPDAELSQLKAVSNDTLPRNLTDNSVGQESSSVLQENAIGLESEVTAPNVLLDGLSVECYEQNTSSNIPIPKAVELKERTVNETLPSLSQGERKSADVGASASAPALSENKLEKTQTATLSKAGRHSCVELSSPQTDKVPQEQTSAQNSHRVIAKPRQRGGAPRSFAVSDFLHLVNEDLHSFKTMNISNSTENELECKNNDASQAKSPLISAEGVMNGAGGDIDLPVAERCGGDCVKEMPNLEVVSAKEDGEISTKTYSNDNLSCSAAFNNHSCQADLEGGGDYHKYTPVVQNMSGNKHLSTEKSQESDKDTSRSEKVSITSTSASDMDDKQKEPCNEECVLQEDVCKIVDKKVTSISKDDICSSDTHRQDSKPARVQLTLALNSLLLEDNKVQKHSSMKDLEQDFEEYCQNVDNEVADLINHMNSTALVLSKDLQELCLMEETKLQQVKEDYKEKLKAAESARKAKPEVDESKSRHDSRSDSDGSQRGSGKRKTTPVKEKYRPPGRKELPPQSYEEMLNQYQQDRQVDYKERSKRTKSKFSKHSDSLNWRTGAPQKDFGKDERHQNSPSKSNRNQTAKELNDEKKATNKHVNQKKDIVEKQADVSNGPDINKQEEKGETVSTKTKQSKQLKQSNEECRQLDDMHSAMLRRRQERKAAKLKAGENGHKENVTEDVASTENSKSEKQGSDIDKNTDNNKPGRSERQHADRTKTNLLQPHAGPVIKGESLNFEKPVEPEDKRVSDNVIAVAVKEETLNMASNKNTIEEKSVLEAGDKMSVSQLTDVIPVMKEERSSIDVSLADEPHKSKVDISTDAVTNQDFSAAIHSQQPVKKKSPVQRKLFDQGDKMQANEPKSVVSKFTEPPSQTTMKPPPEQRMIVSAKAVERQNKPMQPSKSQARHEDIKASEGSTSLEPPNQKAVEPLKTDKVVPTKDVGRNDKPTKPSKSEARLAGIEVSAGSTSSSSELSLSSTSDVSDIASSDVENREVGLKQQCYANKYVQDDDDNIMKNRKSHNKFEADANVVKTLKHSQKQMKALKKLQDYELRKKHYQSDAVVAPEMFGLMYPQHPYYATYDEDQCLKDFSASHSLSWHPKKLSSHNTHKESASRRNRDSSRKDPSHSTVGCSTFYVPCNSEENITKKKMGNSTNSKRKERSYPSHAPALEAKESKQQPVLTPEFLSDESSGSESEDEDSSSVPQDYYSHYVQTQIQQQQQQFAFQPPFSYPQQFPYPFYGIPQYPCYPPQNTPSPYPYQANPAFHGMMPAYPPPLPSMSYPQPASHYNHQHYTYLPQQQAPPHYQPSFEMPTKELSLRSFSLQLKYVKHMTKTLSGLAKKHKISDH